MFTLRNISLLLISILVLGEAGLVLWRHLPVEPSTDPIFSFPPAAENFGDAAAPRALCLVLGAL